MKFLSLVALEVVILTTSSAVGDENFIKMTIFLFQCGLVQERRNLSSLLMELRFSCTNPSMTIDGLVQERRNCSVLAMELRLSYTNPSIYE